jgi:cysteine desulfurase family protein (TIGR01976 family)
MPAMSPALDVARLRAEFPGLGRRVNGRPAVFLDGPAGSQTPRSVSEAVSGYLTHTNANTGGAFATSRESDALLAGARRAAADFLGTDDPDLVVFGPNMTTLTLALAEALSQAWRPGDEIVVTRLEHDANFTPWVAAARRAGATVRQVRVKPADCTLDLEDLVAQLSGRTRLVAVTAASNAVGSVPPLARVIEMAHAAGALAFVDAVHHAPHRLIDVGAWGCDFLVCSAYKFFGPHVGILWGRRELLEQLPARRLRPVADTLPERWMTGTQNHEGIAGTLAAIDYLAAIGRERRPEAAGRRPALVAAFEAIGAHERGLARHALAAFATVPGLSLCGIADPARLDERVPTFSFTHARRPAAAIARHLAGHGIFVWSGNFYALPLTEALGVEPDGLVRVGFLHYNTVDEIERLREALAGGV